MSDKTYMTNQEAADVLSKYFPAVPHAKVRYAAAMGVEALKMKAGIERSLERLEEEYNNIEVQYERNYESGLEDGYEHAIEIIKEEIGYGETET